jgi:hypothetical protein
VVEVGQEEEEVVSAGTRTPAAKPAAPTPAIPKVKYPVAGTPPTKPNTPAAARPAATSPAASRPAAAAPRPTATAAAPKPAAAPAAKPAGSAMDQFAKANPKLAASAAERARTRGTSATTNPLMKDMKSRLPAPKTPSPTTAKTGFDLAKKGVNLAAGFDMFDVVKGYLIGEGYADTEEAALVIMANMSEDWKYSIMESMLDLLPKTRTVISNKPEDKRNPLQKYSDATKPLFSGLPQGKTVIQKPQPRGREFTNPPS